MTRVLLMRHAEALKEQGQRAEDLFSTANLGLSPRGILQAEGARDLLAQEPIEAIATSTLVRAAHTAAIVAGPREVPTRADRRLSEFPVGGRAKGYEGVLRAILDLPARLAAEADPQLADGRTWSWHVREFDAGLRHAAKDRRVILVVSHAIAIRAWLSGHRGTPASDLLTIPMEHAQIVEIEL